MSATPPSQRPFAIRLWKKCWRQVWHRRTAWLLVWLISLIVLYYQWENWRSAKELAAAHRRLIERLGTDDPVKLSPPWVADELNYFAIPAIERWAVPVKGGSGSMEYQFPQDALVPADFIMPEDGGGEAGRPVTPDLVDWMAKRAKAGKPVRVGETAEMVLARELECGNEVITQLASGLDRPQSFMKIGFRELLEEAGGLHWRVTMPKFDPFIRFHEQLRLHLYAAARAGNLDKTRDTALIMLRFAEAPPAGSLMGGVLSLLLHSHAVNSIHEALQWDAWTEPSLTRLQNQLASFEDDKHAERSFANDVLLLFRTGTYIRAHRSQASQLFPELLAPKGSWHLWMENRIGYVMLRHAPVGWIDANIAFGLDGMLAVLGPSQSDAWLTVENRQEAVRLQTQDVMVNPRHFLGKSVLAMTTSMYLQRNAAENLFHRRCLIIACALEKHRMKHGAFPDSLELLKQELLGFPLDDPARPGKVLGYRREAKGYLLWSAGPDAVDNGGLDEKDWLFRVEPHSK